MPKRIMISSTARDLPDHREKVRHACMRLGLFYPDMMEHLTAADALPLDISLAFGNMQNEGLIRYCILMR